VESSHSINLGHSTLASLIPPELQAVCLQNLQREDLKFWANASFKQQSSLGGRDSSQLRGALRQRRGAPVTRGGDSDDAWERTDPERRGGAEIERLDRSARPPLPSALSYATSDTPAAKPTSSVRESLTPRSARLASRGASAAGQGPASLYHSTQATPVAGTPSVGTGAQRTPSVGTASYSARRAPPSVGTPLTPGPVWRKDAIQAPMHDLQQLLKAIQEPKKTTHPEVDLNKNAAYRQNFKHPFQSALEYQTAGLG